MLLYVEIIIIDPTRLAQVLRRMTGENTVVAAAAKRYFLTETMQRFAESAVAVSTSFGGIIQISEFRKVLGLGRNQTIGVLEYFDRIGFTRRLGNTRIVLRNVSEVFPQLT